MEIVSHILNAIRLKNQNKNELNSIIINKHTQYDSTKKLNMANNKVNKNDKINEIQINIWKRPSLIDFTTKKNT